MKHYIKALRPKAWLKNVFVFIPLVFAMQLFYTNRLLPTLAAFGAFCLISSAVYLFNDICDAKKDALHPVKKNRPIASGKIPKAVASVYALLLAGGGIAVSLFAVNSTTAGIAGGYLVLNLCYTLVLKHAAVIDCFCIAAGFVLRVYAGAFASGNDVSNWLFLTIVSASLFMAFGKRRGEISKLRASSLTLEPCTGFGGAEPLPEPPLNTRAVLAKYDAVFLQGMVFVCAGLAIVFYALWALERGNNMIYTVPMVIFMVCKYLLNIHHADDSAQGDPTSVIFADKTFLLSGVIFAGLTLVLLYV
jgi:4-hydroxybenzoate polyprenyltransferase